MNNIVNDVKKEIAKLEKVLEKIDKFKQQAPEGSLKCQKQGERYFYHQQLWNEKEKKWERKYIKKKNFPLIRGLAQKHYFMELEPVVKKNLEILKEFWVKYGPADLERVYDKMCDARKFLVKPEFVSKEEIVRQWLAEEYEENTAYPESRRFETEQGEIVRSKSEVIIANLMYRHKDEIMYKYERPLECVVNGYKRTYYPDFTILNIKTGRVVYWEHAGRMDDPGYVNDFVRKMNVYASNELKLGQDVIVTFETLEEPLDMVLVRKKVAELCRG